MRVFGKLCNLARKFDWLLRPSSQRLRNITQEQASPVLQCGFPSSGGSKPSIRGRREERRSSTSMVLEQAETRGMGSTPIR